MLLLSDGTVMAQNFGGSAWYRLTPDAHGHYVHGTWTTLASMHDTRLYYSSAVLRDGRVFVAGAEWGSGGATAEVYDPLSNTWTLVPPSGQGYGDSASMILPDGNVLVAPVGYATVGDTLIYHPASNSWSPGGTSANYQDEASWVKLPDGSILTIDPFNDNYGRASERYIPSLNAWIGDAPVPVSLYSAGSFEIGAGFLLPDGRVFFLGGTGKTAFYTPSGSTNQGSWTQGPDIPNGLVAQDAPAAMMVNGKILCAVTTNEIHNPSFFYEFDPVANSFVTVPAPGGGASDGAQKTDANRMLDLPDGTVLYSHWGSDLYVYQPDGAPLASGKPAISSIGQNPDGSYHVTGTLLNGISQGAAFGDDAQMDSNYPLVRLTDGAGKVQYARTFNWSSTGIMTGNRPVSTDFAAAAGLPLGTYSLQVVANGISSDPVAFYGPLPPPPRLNIQRKPAGAIAVSWPSPSSGYILQQTSTMTSANWVNVSQVPADDGVTRSVTLPRTAASLCFRLQK